MVEMKDPASGVELHVPEEQVETLLTAGFVKAEADEKPNGRGRKKKVPEEAPEETE